MTKEQEAIELLKEHEPPEGYHLAFSGGKDSCVIKELAIRSGVKFESHFAITSIDPHELLSFIKEHHPDVIWHRPEMTMYQLIVKNGILPTGQRRYCCRYLKEYLGGNSVMITGIRAKESPKRAKRNQVEISEMDKTKKFVHPIFYWSEKDVWNYIRSNDIPYCKLYDEGFLRIGCIGCPMHTANQHTYEFNRWKQHKKAYLWAINKCIENGSFKNFDNAEDVFSWWISGKSTNEYFGDKEQLRFNMSVSKKENTDGS